ncbi:MAG: aromatic ring-hydroxylating dioxygenase subunit alpha [Rhodospirillaceae bacterium]|nr:aromatic ring-hydroxylating dioxygenase subunit alpha [Rhodospirillaceae bacterium]
MWIRNAWYVAAWAGQVTEGEPFARIYLGEPVVLYRTTDGTVTALEDRCCHRLAPLSRGRLEGDNLRCMYHGLMFDPSGACVEIPGETRIPEKYRVRRYPVVERQNLIWIWMGDEALADPGDIIDWPYLDDPAWPYEGGYLHYKSNYQLIVDNFLDFSHLPYVHEKTIGTASYAEQRPRITHTDVGLHIENTTDDTPPTPAFAPFGNFAGNVDRWSIYDFHIRGNCVVADFGMAPVGEGGHAGDRRNAIQFRHLSALTPETADTCHYHFAQPRDFGLDAEGLDRKVLDVVVKAFHEDKDIIEAQQIVIDLDRDAPMLPLEVDRALLHVRRQIDRMIAAETPVSVAAE